MTSGFNRVSGYSFKLRTDIFNKAVVALLVVVQILLEIMVAEFVAILILAILIAVDLDSVIGEMDELVVCILYLILIAAGSNVALVVPVSLCFAILSQ